ncbi:hypothetical protein FB451DRAFT_1188960 [Mycena latifolia]|nr:hypothetical protein FB451DRAFT_1188960 [Mycena latifolia]
MKRDPRTLNQVSCGPSAAQSSAPPPRPSSTRPSRCDDAHLRQRPGRRETQVAADLPPRADGGVPGVVVAVELEQSPLGDEGNDGRVLNLVLELEAGEAGSVVVALTLACLSRCARHQDTASHAFLIVVVDEYPRSPRYIPLRTG